MASALHLLAAIALALGVFVASRNWYSLCRFGVGPWVMPVPLVGGVALALGLLGFEATRRWWWAGLVADLGTAWLPVVMGKLILDGRAPQDTPADSAGQRPGGCPAEREESPCRQRRLP